MESRSSPRPFRLPWLLVLLLAAAALAGCLGSDASDGVLAEVEGYREARQAPGIELDPVQGASDVEVKLLAPACEQVEQPGTQPVVLLVHDPTRGEPVTDADASLRAHMPAMGHGTGPEEHPVHTGEGIYVGETTWSMAGTWELHLEVRLADGERLAYEPEIRVGEHEAEVNAAPVEPLGSFGEVMAAPGTVYEGELVAFAREAANVSGDIVGADHERRETLAFDQGALDHVEIQAQLDATSPIDMLNVTLVDPEGALAAVLELDARDGEAEASVDEAPVGEWSLEVDGDGIGARYEVHVEAVYHARHVDVKLLDPADPSQAAGGDRPLLFAVFDAIDPEPITDAAVNLTARSPGGTIAIEAVPERVGHGQHRAWAAFDEEGDWRVAIAVELPSGEAHRYELELEVVASG